MTERLRSVSVLDEFRGAAIIVRLDGGGASTNILKAGMPLADVAGELRRLADRLEQGAAYRAGTGPRPAGYAGD